MLPWQILLLQRILQRSSHHAPGARCRGLRRSGTNVMSRIVVREAGLKDIPFVRSLAIQSVVHGIPPTREVAPEEVQRHVRETLANLEAEIKLNPSVKVLVAEDGERQELLGYIILILDDTEGSTGEKQALIHDLAVKPSQWGRYVVHHLARKAEEISKQHGRKYIVGEISINNERTWALAVRRLGYQIERYQIVKKLI